MKNVPTLNGGIPARTGRTKARTIVSENTEWLNVDCVWL